jgi:hypothetical protein
VTIFYSTGTNCGTASCFTVSALFPGTGCDGTIGGFNTDQSFPTGIAMTCAPGVGHTVKRGEVYTDGARSWAYPKSVSELPVCQSRSEVCLGLGRSVALRYHSSALHRNR